MEFKKKNKPIYVYILLYTRTARTADTRIATVSAAAEPLGLEHRRAAPQAVSSRVRGPKPARRPRVPGGVSVRETRPSPGEHVFTQNLYIIRDAYDAFTTQDWVAF